MARNTIRFTKAALDRLPLPPAGKRAEYYDEQTTGLHVRVSSSGTKTFALLRWIAGEGKPERVTLGKYPACSIESARKLAGKANHAISEGMNPAEAIRERKAESTLGELFELYVTRHLEPRGKKSVQALREMWERYLGALPQAERKPHGRKRTKHEKGVNWQDRKLSSIKRSEVLRLHSDLGAAGVHTTANRVVELLSAMIARGTEWGVFTGSNPAIGIEPFREVKRDRFLHADELPRFFAALAAEPSDDIRDFVLLSLLTGARKANVLGMRWCDLSLERAEWKIPDGDSKNGESIVVPLMPEALEVLARRASKLENEAATDRAAKVKPDAAKTKESKSPSPFVFPSDSKTGHMESPKKGWRRVLDAAGIENLRVHDLRRSLGSWQAKTGASLTIIGKSLGHRSASATMIYARLDVDPVRESVTRATEAMIAAGSVNTEEGATVLPFKKKTA